MTFDLTATVREFPCGVSGNRSRAMTHMAEWDRNSSAPPPDPHQMHTQSPGPPTLTSHIVPSYLSELRIYVCNRNSSFGAATCGGSGILHTHTHMGHNGAFVMDWWISSVTFSHYENVARFLLVWLLSAAPISICHLPLAPLPGKCPFFPLFCRVRSWLRFIRQPFTYFIVS